MILSIGETRRSALLACVMMSATLITACSTWQDSTFKETSSVVNEAVFATPTVWQPLSRTATGITGQITLEDTKITFGNQASMSLALLEHDEQTGQTLFRVTSRDNPALLNGNLLCGQAPVDFLVVQIDQAQPGQSEMQLTAYYYPDTLRLSDLPLGGALGSNDLARTLCALYTYVSAPA